MSLSFDVNDGRHFKNPYADFNSDEVDSFSDQITDKIKTTLKSSIEFLKYNEKDWRNHDDVSIYTGTSGIAYLFYHYGVVSHNIDYIEEAKRILNKYPEKSISKKQISFIIGAAGPLALKAVLYTRKFNFGQHVTSDKKVNQMVEKLESLCNFILDDKSGVPDELLYGRVGYLYALLFINSETSTKIIKDKTIKQVVNSVIKSGKNYSTANRSEPPLMYDWHDQEYLGGAHGVAGILYLLLQAKEHLDEDQLKDVEDTLQYLIKIRYKSGNFPSSVPSNTDKLVHWCHGAPSMTALFCLAYQVFNKEQYLQIALDCGEVVWTRGLLKKGYSICHGVSGNAYTFLQLYQQTKDKKHLYRALKFGEWILNEKKLNEIREPDRPLSLFEGKAGQLYFLTDLLDPLSAKFPGYTV